MKKSFEEFKTDVDNFNLLIQQKLSDDVNERWPIYDGPFSMKDYYDAELKVMWLMKEPYDEHGGGWSFAHAFSDKVDFYQRFVRGGSRPTWQPIAYVTAGVLDGLKNWNDIDDMDVSLMDFLAKVSFVNIHKMPSQNGDGTRTNMDHIHSSYSLSKELLNEQIELLNPDVIICGGTFGVISNDLPKCEIKGKVGGVGYYVYENRIFIDAYHPAQTVVKREVYVDTIIDAIKFGLQARNRQN